MKTIDLSCNVDISDYLGGVIIHCNSGVQYSNQTGGTCCNHPSLDGVYIPICVDEDIQKFLLDVCEGISKETANELEKLIDGCVYYPFRLNILKLDEVQEAWVPIIINTNLSEYSPFKDFEGFCGVLTWENSD